MTVTGSTDEPTYLSILQHCVMLLRYVPGGGGGGKEINDYHMRVIDVDCESVHGHLSCRASCALTHSPVTYQGPYGI